MRAALALAARGLGRVAPNPAVGCILVKDGRIVGRGWTQRGGRPHAEAEALRHAGEAARGASVYVTFEPCAHHGETPPCAESLIAAGIARCFVATRDPDERVDGRGVERLREGGIILHEGLCQAAAEDLNAGFIMSRRLGRPLVTVKLATSLDGRIACANGDSRWVTSSEARRHVHAERSRHDAVMVGSGTALADDPRLDVRLAGLEGEKPLRVVLDGEARLPVTHDLVVRAGSHPSCLLTGADLSQSRLDPYREVGMKVLTVARAENGHLDLVETLKALARAGVTRLLVEGGGGLAAALARHGLIDRLMWYCAPKLVGAEGLPAVGPLGLERMVDAEAFEREEDARFFDGDLLSILVNRSRRWRSA